LACALVSARSEAWLVAAGFALGNLDANKALHADKVFSAWRRFYESVLAVNFKTKFMYYLHI
jgi:hypothetical protein